MNKTAIGCENYVYVYRLVLTCAIHTYMYMYTFTEYIYARVHTHTHMLTLQENERSKDVIIDNRFHKQIIGTKGEKIREIRDRFNGVQVSPLMQLIL